jgi:peptidyl-prolyl cis-trans isomerase D
VKVTDDEVAEAYESRKETFTRGGKTAPLAAVREAIAAELRHVGGMDRASDEAKQAHDTIYQEENFEGYAGQNRLKLATTDFFPLNRPPAELAGIKDFAKTAFALRKGDVSGVLSDERGYYVVKVEARKPAYVPELKAIEANVARAYTAEEAKKLCRREAEEMLGRLKKGEGFAALASAKGLPVGETGFFIPGTAVPKLGLSQELAEALFQISEKKPYPDSVVEMGERLVLIRFKARQAASDAQFAGQKDALRGALLTAKRNEAVRSWLEETRKAMIKSGRLEITKDLKDL